MFSLLTLLDDIATTFDDVAIMTKVAIEKTSVLMSDDLAVNAAVVTGTPAERELPIVKAIFIGSLLNKVYAIAGVLTLMAVYEPILKIVLFAGGLFLSFEGAHKVYEKLFHKNHDQKENKKISEKDRIKGAVRTDLVLSIEIILIAKQSITGDFLQQIMSLCLVGLAASIIIYGLVGVLVKVDDFGLMLIQKDFKKTGLSLVRSMPYIMKGLGIIGTIAMFLVGGGIVAHTFHIPNYIPEMLQHLILGIITGVLVMIPFELYQAKAGNK
jgi:predicted DNA repair protein MutK